MSEDIYRSRLSKKFGEKTALFVSSLKEDERIFEVDLEGTEAHNIMLFEQGIISKDELIKILLSLEKIRSLKKTGELEVKSNFEDIHEFIESYVIDEIGVEVGGKLHTGRSRNDQVVTDIRMQVRSDLNEISKKIIFLTETLLKIAEKNIFSIMILYTHTQHAQIGTFSHYLLAYTENLFRSLQRIDDCYKRVNVSPLGAGPIGGSSLEINRIRTASLLGFDGVLENSIDAVSSRDFALETAAVLTILMSDLSRIAEDLIIWSSSEFGYVELADEYSSASSIMPQKKNPCTLELIRGKTGHVYGALTSLLTMVKGVPSGYNRDLQETKPPLWVIFDTVKSSVEILTEVINTMKVDEKRMLKVASESDVFALDLSETLFKELGISFREAHKIVGTLIKDGKVKPGKIKSEDLENIAKKVLGKKIRINKEIIEQAVDVRFSLENRKTMGGSSPKEVNRMLNENKKKIECQKLRKKVREDNITKAQKKLKDIIKRYTGTG